MTPLEEYRHKRDFQKTSEPAVRTTKGGRPWFVVHYHQSRRPHYDLRLAAEGVLKSWAIPKGPSLNPNEKHLAVQVEDHPYSYKDFEGIIPAGNYGAGTVMIWDEGPYRLISGGGVSENIKKGHLTFLLLGEKLKGEFALVRLRKAASNDWLLIKAADKFATNQDVKEQNRSVRSGRSIDGIRQVETDHARIKPMLATLIEGPFDNIDWIFEIKWDGFRAIAIVNKGGVDLYSRNFKTLNERFPTITESLAEISDELIVDGEIVAVDKKGRSSFQALAGGRDRTLIYYLFDLLEYRGQSTMLWPLEERRAKLKQLSEGWSTSIRYSESIEERGVAFYDAAKKEGLEGIIAKRKGSLYQPGKRSRDWLKIKITQTQEAVIGGYTEGRDSRPFGSLVLGVYHQGALHYIGKVGTGFDGESMKRLLSKMQKIKTEDSPFSNLRSAKATWLKPNLVAEIKYQEWTREGHLRQPVFLGLREDKDPREVRLES